ncbi:hypothetical protein MASR2M48_13080 [Spirochaetota bacterium]
MKRIVTICILALMVAGPAAFAQDVPKILAELDRQGDFSGKDFSALYTIVSQKPGEKTL